MKYLLIILIFAVNLFSQFSSNVDYKEISRQKNSFGVSYSNTMAENKWKKNFIGVADTLKFTGNYDLFKNDFNLNGYYYFNEDRLTYSAGFSKESYTSIVTIDTLGTRETIDLGEKDQSDFSGSFGYVIGEDKFGGSVDFNNLSYEDSKCIIISLNGFINMNTSSGNKYGLDITYSLISDDSLRYSVRSYDVVSPNLDIGAHYTKVSENYEMAFYSRFSRQNRQD
jgi:hypothetical protein